MTDITPELDSIDHLLIGELQREPRATFSELAAVVDLSSVAVASRVRRLRDEGVIVIGAILEPEILGTGTSAAVLVEVSGSSREVASSIAELPEVTFAAITSGQVSLHVEVRCGDNSHLVSVLDAIRRVEGVTSLAALTYLEVTKEYSSPPVSSDRPVFDNVDHELVNLLKVDGRASYASLAESVNMSASTVATRVNRLIGSGSIVIATTVASWARPHRVDAGLTCRVSGSAHGVAGTLAARGDFSFVAVTTGPFDLAITATFDSRTELLAVADMVRSTTGIAAVQTYEYLEIVKEDYRLVQMLPSVGPTHQEHRIDKGA